jgi:hypothetical protein
MLKISPQLATLLARQRSYTRSAERIFVSTDAVSILTDASGTTCSPDMLRGLATSTHTFARRWQHARGLRLALAFIRPVLAAPRIGIYSPGVRNMLGDCASHWYSFVPALATHSGATPCIGIHSPWRWQHARGLRLVLVFIRPSVGNTLEDCAFHWYSFAPAMATHSGTTSYNPMLAMLGGCTLRC